MKLIHVESNEGQVQNAWLQKRIIEPLNEFFRTLFNVNGGITFVGPNSYHTITGITATASPLTQAAAVLLTAEFNNVTTASILNAGVRLGDLISGSRQVVKNNGAFTIRVYPFLGSAIDNEGENQPVIIAPGAEVVFNKINSTTWESNIEAAMIGTTYTDTILDRLGSGINLATAFNFSSDGMVPISEQDETKQIGSSALAVKDIFSGKHSVRGKSVVDDVIGIGLLTRGYVSGSADLSSTNEISAVVPTGAKLLGCQLRVKSTISFSGGATWSATYAQGNEQDIDSSLSPTAGTVVNKFFDSNADPDLTTDNTVIVLSPDAGTFTTGIVEGIIYYEYFTSIADV